MPRYGGSLAFEAAMNESPYSQYDSGEDGMFEENIMYPVALYSEMLWDAGHKWWAVLFSFVWALKF